MFSAKELVKAIELQKSAKLKLALLSGLVERPVEKLDIIDYELIVKWINLLQDDLDCLYLMIADSSNDNHLSPEQSDAIETAARRQQRPVPDVVLESRKFFADIEQELRKLK